MIVIIIVFFAITNCYYVSLATLKETRAEASNKSSEPAAGKEKRIDHIAAEKMHAINSAQHSLKKIATLSNEKTKRLSKANLNTICESPNNNNEFKPGDQSLITRVGLYFQLLCIRFNYFVVSPDGQNMYLWLIFLNIFVIYNLWIIIVRQSFDNFQLFYAHHWQLIDGVSDFVYLLDILVQFRTGYLEQGLLVYESGKLAKNYLRSCNVSK